MNQTTSVQQQLLDQILLLAAVQSPSQQQVAINTIKKQPTQQRVSASSQKLQLKPNKAMLELLISFLNSLDTDSTLAPADVNLFIEITMRYFLQVDASTHAVQGTTEKPATEACSDVLVLLLVQLAQLSDIYALQIIGCLIRVVQDSERRPNQNCRSIFTAMHYSLQLSDRLMRAAKEKELANKLLGLLTRLYSEEVEQDNILKPQQQSEINLNVLIMAGNQRLMDSILQNQTNFNQAQVNTLESLKEGVSSNRQISPERFAAEKISLRLNFNVAPSQTPLEFSSNQLIAEELKEVVFDEQSVESKSKERNHQNAASKVPPIMVDQIIKQQQRNPGAVSGLKSTSTSVMNNFFNLPHGERFQSHHSAARGNQSATKNYKYQAQGAIAQSRLTRRQFSISRVNSKQSDSQGIQNKLRLKESPSIERNPYQDDGMKGRIDKVPALNLNQIKAIENEKEGKSVERQPQTFVNLPTNNASDEGEELDNSGLYENRMVGAGQSAEQKLKQLAIQLGESCLTYDLAALMSQKREFDLAITARKAVHKPEFVRQLSLAVDKQRSFSHNNRANSSFVLVQRLTEFEADTKLLGLNDKNQIDVQQYSQSQLAQRETRILVLNLIDLLLQQYSIEESRFLRKPAVLVTCFLNSNFSRDLRRQNQVEELLNGLDFKKLHKRLKIQDQEYRYVYFSCVRKNRSNDKTNQKLDEILVQFLQNSQGKSQTQIAARNSTITNQRDLLTRIRLLSETRVVQRILQKFSFVNEDILKSHIVNEIKSFTARESNSMSVFNAQGANSQSMRYQVETQFVNYDQDKQDKLQNITPISKGKDCISQISNPFQFWSNNGIGYDLSKPKEKQSAYVSHDHIRRKLDTVLNQVSRRIIYIFNQGLEITSFEFADSLTAEISTLNTYMENHCSRVVLKQFIDVCLEPIFMIKKAMIEITLEMRILAIDLSRVAKSGLPQDLQRSPKTKSANSDMLLDSDARNGQDYLRDDIRKELIRSQARLRDLYAEFLLLIALIIKRPQTQESLKLLNDVFFFDEVWSESVKAFTISLFLTDLISPVFQTDFNSVQTQIFDQLRGINIVNFEERQFFDQLLLFNDPVIIKKGKQAVYSSFIQAVSVIKYLNSMIKFFHQVSSIHFPKSFNRTLKRQQDKNLALETKVGNQNVTPPQAPTNQATDAQQKYWKTVVRRVLYQLMFLIDQPNGLFYLYIQKNCLNYSSADQTASTRESLQLTPVNFQITQQVLRFLKKIFNMPNQFTKYVFVEELMLFFIRTHYISFVKLYSKNYKKKRAEEQENNLSFVPNIELCKSHLECLLAIAKQRNDDTRLKLYQFKICAFLLQEIGLEYEIQQRKKTFMKFRKQEEVKLEKPVESHAPKAARVNANQKIEQINQPIVQAPIQIRKGPPVIPSLKVGGLGFSTIVKENGKTQEELDVESLVQAGANQKQQQVPPVSMPPAPVKKVPFIPALKVGGLGLSTLVKENGKTQEEMDVDAQVKGNSQQPVQTLQQAAQPQATQQQKKAPFIPQLKVGGLGFSTLIKDNGKTQEELDVDQLVKQPKQQTLPQAKEQSDATDDSEYEIQVIESKRSQAQSKRATQNMDGEGSSSDESYYRELEKIKASAPPPPKQNPLGKLGFKLQLGGLGLSTLVKEDGKTQEELDVEAQVKEGKVQTQLKTVEQIDNNTFSRNTAFDKTDPEKLNRYKLKHSTPQVAGKNALPKQAYFQPKSPNAISGFQESQLSTIQKDHNIQSPKFELSQVKPNQQMLDDISEAQNVARDADLNAAPVAEVTEEMLYLNERKMRPIYQDEELHVLMLSLMMCLLLKPQRGTLDELYCSQFPIDNEHQNFLYLLHFHLSNVNNQHITPSLLEKMETLNPPHAGQRLLKLLCPSLFDISLYNEGKGWVKLAEGAYGVVYEVALNVAEPKTVAVKKMSLPQSIFDRCVLHDIFTEITCLEELRLESCVTDLYDYGVDDTSYYIVMRRYGGSLKEWRLKQKPGMYENLSLYLSIYREVLRSFKAIHQRNVTHYDIKCDNILIDFKGGVGESRQDLFDDFKIIVADFGECHMFTSDKDEFQSRNKGTEFIKSPEMLQLAIATRKDTDKYDRRKKVGTNGLSDVWALGCLLFELLTGEVLFETEEYFEFHVRLTQKTMPLLLPEKLAKINDNVYLIDFLKYVLVRDIQLRPTLESIVKRFEHIHALLVNTTSANDRFGLQRQSDFGDAQLTNRGGKVQFTDYMQKAALIAEKVQQKTAQEKRIEIDQTAAQNRYMPEVMSIMKDVFISSLDWIKTRAQHAVKLKITHVIIDSQLCSRELENMFEVYQIRDPLMNAYKLTPGIMDFLRAAALVKGRVLFVEAEDKWRGAAKSGQNIAEIMLICLASINQTSAYETYTLVKAQNLFFKVDSARLVELSNFVSMCRKTQSYLITYPQFSCICGACVIILKRNHATYQNMQIMTCRCSQYYKNVDSSRCPSTGCNDFVNFMQTYYAQHVKRQNMLPDGKLHWGFVEAQEFMFGPENSGCSQVGLERQFALNLSKTIDENSQIVAISEKTGFLEQSLSRRRQLSGKQSFIQKPNYNQIIQAPVTSSIRDVSQWRLMKCKQCQVWTHAYSEQEQMFAVLLNNRLKEGQRDLQLSNLTQPV